MRTRWRGQALVEFALVVPLLILLLFGLVDIGRMVYVNNAISEGARDGARWGSVQNRSFDAAGRTAIEVHTEGLLSGVPDSTVTVSCVDGAGNPRTECVSNNILSVVIDTPFQVFTPIIAGIVGPQTLSATAQVAVQY